MAIRRAAPGHLSLLLPLVEAFYAADDHDFDATVATDALRPLLQDDRFGVVFLIEDGDDVAGYAVITWGWSLESGGRDARLDEIFVREPGRGVGSRALCEILDDLRSRRLPRLMLETKRSDDRARAFCVRHGFEEGDSTWMSLHL